MNRYDYADLAMQFLLVLALTLSLSIHGFSPASQISSPSTISTSHPVTLAPANISQYALRSTVNPYPIRKQYRFPLLLSVSLVLLSSFTLVPLPPYTSFSVKAPATLGVPQLLRGAILVALSGGVGLALSSGRRLQLSRSLLVAASRCFLQLYLMGGLLLTHVLLKSSPWIVLGWIGLTVLVAAREAMSRPQYFYNGLYWQIVTSLVLSVTIILSVTVGGNILGPIQPWFSPRTLIPVTGMLLGNALTAVSLGASSWTKELVENRHSIEARLSRGATWQQAVQPTYLSALQSALTPLINALSVAGIVHIPGLMTGQILAGRSAQQAAAYQVILFFLVASMASLSVQVFLRLSSQKLIDQRLHRVCNERLRPAEGLNMRPLAMALWSSIRSWATSTPAISPGSLAMEPPSTYQIKTVLNFVEPRLSPDRKPVLSVRNLQVQRTNADVSFDLYPGERVGLQGRSGCGKSQLIRTLVGLESGRVTSGVVQLLTATRPWSSLPELRRSILLVAQDRLDLPGTPRDFWGETKTYEELEGCSTQDMNIDQVARTLGCNPALLDQPWSTLSGGQSQLVSLTLAISSCPKVLLLDESTSAMDETMQLKVETALRQYAIPIMMISHSSKQLQRFCDRILSIDDSVSAV